MMTGHRRTGTIGLEILRLSRGSDHRSVGGGLIAGIATIVKEETM
jgi:threonine dehydratase